MIDPATYGRYQEAEALAKRRGLALSEVLDSRRLLLTPARQHQIEVKILEDLLRRLDRQTPNKIMSYYLGRVDGTPAEMFAAMQQWLEAVVRNQANKTLEDL